MCQPSAPTLEGGEGAFNIKKIFSFVCSSNSIRLTVTSLCGSGFLLAKFAAVGRSFRLLPALASFGGERPRILMVDSCAKFGNTIVEALLLAAFGFLRYIQNKVLIYI